MFILAALTMWSESIVDFIVYYLILDEGWDSEMYGTITAIQKFVPVIMNPFWVAMAEVQLRSILVPTPGQTLRSSSSQVGVNHSRLGSTS